MRLFRVFGLSAVAVLGLCASASGQSRFAESQVKAAFVFNFVKFVEWPDEVWEGPATPLRLCIRGQGAMAAALEALRDRTAKNRAIQVLYVQNMREVASCHVLFVAGGDPQAIREIIATIRQQPLLTISDIGGFAGGGGIIGLFLAEERVRFAINVGAARMAGLRISSQLLKLGMLVSTDEK